MRENCGLDRISTRYKRNPTWGCAIWAWSLNLRPAFQPLNQIPHLSHSTRLVPQVHVYYKDIVTTCNYTYVKQVKPITNWDPDAKAAGFHTYVLCIVELCLLYDGMEEFEVWLSSSVGFLID